MAVLGIGVAHHHRAAVDIKMGMHGAALLVRRMDCGDLGRERLFVELRGFHRAVHRQIGNRPAFDLRIDLDLRIDCGFCAMEISPLVPIP